MLNYLKDKMKRKGVVMNKLFLPLILIGAISCSSVEEKSRKLASVEGDLTGTILGYAKYREKTKRKGSANPKFGPRYRISTNSTPLCPCAFNNE